ncbi:hypothetical protein CDL15_Pgr020656 [Punica granatum]|uniref:Uncharacterized protein n=1 Tax=Punica granatum TaxID=22663 RepID=A0A218VSI5_PUNGR|nr:hypothetical protein CDL15_Pgr020656 [Punica granatum]
MYSVGPTVNSDPSFGRVFSYRTSKAVVMVTVGVLFWSRPEGLDLSGTSLVIGAAASLRMPRSCDEGLELWGGTPTYPEGSGIRARSSSCCLQYL